MALSGSFSGSVNKGYQKIRIDWVGTQSIANNTTTITAKMYLITGPLYVGARASSIAIGGDLGSFTAPAISTGSATTIYLGSVTKTITHDNDGTKSITMSALYNVRATLSGTYYENITASSGAITLDTIPRASAIATFNNFTIGDGIPIALDRKVTSFTHDIALKAGDVVIATRTGIGASYTLTLDTAEQDKIYALIPSSNSITVTLYCDTKSGTTKIGSTQIKNATANVGASIVPTFTSISATEQNANVTNIIGSKFVQSLSSIKFTINGATGVKNSTIKSYKIEFNGVSYSESSVVISNINKSGNIVATATITDSRGKTATKTLTVNLLPYSAPAILSFTLTRYENNKIDPFGTFAMIKSVGAVSSIINSTEKNGITYKLYYRLRGGTTWTLISTPAASGLSSDATDIVGTFDRAKSYDIKLDVSDKFKTTSSVLVLSTAKVTLSWDDIGVGIGKVRENGILDVGGDIYENGTRLGNKYSPISHEHTDYLPLSGGTINGNLDVTGIGKIKYLKSYAYRPSSADRPVNADFNSLIEFMMATSSMTVNKPPTGDGFILTFNWDNSGGWNSQFALGGSNGDIATRGMKQGVWQPWNTFWHNGNCDTNKNSPGYLKFPNGIIIQWATCTVPANTSNIICTYPIAFPTKCLVASVLNVYTNSRAIYWTSSWSAKDAITIFPSTGSNGSVPTVPSSCYILAIGY